MSTDLIERPAGEIAEVSSLYTVKAGINPLVSCAQPLFSIIQRLNITEQIKNSQKLKHQIEHELMAFEAQALERGYSQEVSLVAKYLLCAVIDEMFSQQQWESITDFLAIGRFTPSSDEGPEAQDRFFLILDNIFEHHDKHIDLLELCYLCLSFGFEGKYRDQKRLALDEVMEKVYTLIKQHRQFENSRILIASRFKSTIERTLKSPRIAQYYVLFGLLLIGIFLGCNYLLGL